MHKTDRAFMLQSARSHLYTLGNLHCWGGQMPNQTVALWEDLKKLTRSVVEEMNRDAELSSRTGGLEFRFADVHSVVVTKLSSPQMFLSVRLNGEVLEVYSRLTLTEPDSKQREFREELVIQIDESGSSLRNEAGQVFSVDEAVFYILRPFLHLRAGCS